MTPKPLQNAIYEDLATVGAALANPHRLKMLQLLTHGEKTIDELAQLTNQSIASASAHMKTLKAGHLVSTEKRGRSSYCRLSDPKVADLWLRLRDLGETSVPAVREIMRDEFDNDEGLSPLTIEQLHTKLVKGRFALIDLRPEAEFAQGHIPRARSIPVADLREMLPKLPRKTPLLVYCRGPFCAAALAGNRELRDNRFSSQRLRFSVPEWKAAGFNVETS